jgi:hypothetical protein
MMESAYRGLKEEDPGGAMLEERPIAQVNFIGTHGQVVEHVEKFK